MAGTDTSDPFNSNVRRWKSNEVKWASLETTKPHPGNAASARMNESLIGVSGEKHDPARRELRK